MGNDNTLHIAVITDEGYVIPTITMLTSTRYNKSPERSYIIHVLGNNLSEFSIRKFRELDRLGIIPPLTVPFHPGKEIMHTKIHIQAGNSSCLTKFGRSANLLCLT